MDDKRITSIVKQSITKADLKSISPLTDKHLWREHLCALISAIPYVGSPISQEIQAISDYKLCEFFRKFTAFIYGLEGTSVEQRVSFAVEIDEKAEDYAEYVITSMVDRMDNINKEVILANLVKAKLFDRITIEDFFRLASILERIPYVDLPHLKKYENDYYDESGDTELLASTGVIKQTVVGDNKYALSELGIKLIEHGLRVEVDKGSIRQGTEVGLEWANANAITAEEIDQLFEEKEKEKADKKLEDDDAGAFYYDVARGK